MDSLWKGVHVGWKTGVYNSGNLCVFGMAEIERNLYKSKTEITELKHDSVN